MNARTDINTAGLTQETAGPGGDEQIYREIVDAIVKHRLPPGARLPEDALAEVFGVSRTGIRRVLHRLALERLITVRRHKGAHVTRPTVTESHDVFDARRMLETATLESTIDRASKENLKELREIVARETRAQRGGDHSAAIQLSARFHTRLAEIAGNHVMAEFLGQLTSRSSLIIAVYGSPLSVGCDCGEHGELVDLIQGKRKQEARAWMEQHLRRIEQSLQFGSESEEVLDLAAIFGPAASKGEAKR